jgi:hypothetical protein
MEKQNRNPFTIQRKSEDLHIVNQIKLRFKSYEDFFVILSAFVPSWQEKKERRTVTEEIRRSTEGHRGTKKT